MSRQNMFKAHHDLQAAAEYVARDLRDGDVVLIKGRPKERFSRVALVLMGRTVRCRIQTCNAFTTVRCDTCNMLERGWDGLRVDT
jgi:hypothetical protein